MKFQLFLDLLLLALEALTENPEIKRGDNKWVDKIFDLNGSS